jgi:hypothetical protein
MILTRKIALRLKYEVKRCAANFTRSMLARQAVSLEHVLLRYMSIIINIERGEQKIESQFMDLDSPTKIESMRVGPSFRAPDERLIDDLRLWVRHDEVSGVR